MRWQLRCLDDLSDQSGFTLLRIADAIEIDLGEILAQARKEIPKSAK